MQRALRAAQRRPARLDRAQPGPGARTARRRAAPAQRTKPAIATASPMRCASVARGLGVEFRFDQSVDGLVTEGGRVIGVRGRRGAVEGRPLRARLRQLLAQTSSRRSVWTCPCIPVKGYSLTVPLVDPAFAPQSTVLDETYKIAVTRFDDRIRVGGMAELGGFDLRLDPRRRATLELVVNDLFPGGDLARATFWTGLRPMTPDSTPIDRRDEVPEPVPQHRARHAGLDHGLRIGQADLGHGDGPAHGDQRRRAWHRSLHAELRAWSLDSGPPAQSHDTTIARPRQPGRAASQLLTGTADARRTRARGDQGQCLWTWRRALRAGAAGSRRRFRRGVSRGSRGTAGGGH